MTGKWFFAIRIFLTTPRLTDLWHFDKPTGGVRLGEKEKTESIQPPPENRESKKKNQPTPPAVNFSRVARTRKLPRAERPK